MRQRFLEGVWGLGRGASVAAAVLCMLATSSVRAEEPAQAGDLECGPDEEIKSETFSCDYMFSELLSATNNGGYSIEKTDWIYGGEVWWVTCEFDCECEFSGEPNSADCTGANNASCEPQTVTVTANDEEYHGGWTVDYSKPNDGRPTQATVDAHCARLVPGENELNPHIGTGACEAACAAAEAPESVEVEAECCMEKLCDDPNAMNHGMPGPCYYYELCDEMEGDPACDDGSTDDGSTDDGSTDDGSDGFGGDDGYGGDDGFGGDDGYGGDDASDVSGWGGYGY